MVNSLAKKHHRGLAALVFAAALAGAFWRAPNPGAASFAAPPAASPSPLPAVFSSETLAAAEAAEPCLTELPDGRLAAAWSGLAETDETARVIRYSVLDKNGWRLPQPVASRESTAAGSFANEQEIGNPLLYAEGSWLHLWYTSRSGWAARAIQHSVSTDGGRSWSKPVALRTAPLASDTLLRAAPVALADGGLGLAISSQLLAATGAYLRLAPTGEIVDKQRLPLMQPGLQPAVAVLDAQHALALLHHAADGSGQLQAAVTANGGQSWQAAPALPIANPDTPVALLRLQSGRLLLAGNPGSGRGTLALWLSADGGQTWQASRTLESADDGAAEFTAPALLLGRDTRIHLVYAWRRQGIKHLAFSEAWLDGEQP